MLKIALYIYINIYGESKEYNLNIYIRAKILYFEFGLMQSQ